MTSWLLTKLLGSIYHGRDDIMASAIEHGRVPSHQGHWDSTEELACWLSLVTALLSGQGLPQSPHHIRCHTMESPKSFYCQRREFKPLGSTSFCSISHFPIIGFGESLACFRCCASQTEWTVRNTYISKWREIHIQKLQMGGRRKLRLGGRHSMAARGDMGRCKFMKLSLWGFLIHGAIQ